MSHSVTMSLILFKSEVILNHPVIGECYGLILLLWGRTADALPSSLGIRGHRPQLQRGRHPLWGRTVAALPSPARYPRPPAQLQQFGIFFPTPDDHDRQVGGNHQQIDDI